jgi:hypothetical protein
MIIQYGTRVITDLFPSESGHFQDSYIVPGQGHESNNIQPNSTRSFLALFANCCTWRTPIVVEMYTSFPRIQ